MPEPICSGMVLGTRTDIDTHRVVLGLREVGITFAEDVTGGARGPMQ